MHFSPDPRGKSTIHNACREAILFLHWRKEVTSIKEWDNFSITSERFIPKVENKFIVLVLLIETVELDL